jgi:hypothetical protein
MEDISEMHEFETLFPKIRSQPRKSLEVRDLTIFCRYHTLKPIVVLQQDHSIKYQSSQEKQTEYRSMGPRQRMLNLRAFSSDSVLPQPFIDPVRTENQPYRMSRFFQGLKSE